MIDEIVYSKNYIESQFKDSKIDYATLERVIYAFTLLEKLSNSKVNFVFKGGTCLALLTNKLKRFSVDIDIICNSISYNDFASDTEFLNEFASSPFKRFEEDFRKKSATKKLHYKFYYDSVFNNSENYILLDVVFEDNIDLNLYELRDLNLDFIMTSNPFKSVRTPSISEMIADKSSAFAPNTTGILYEKGRFTEIIKQMFDIGVMLQEEYDINDVIKYYKLYVDKQIENRGLDISYEDVVLDSIGTIITLIKMDDSDENYKKLKMGLNSFKAFTITSFLEKEQLLITVDLLELFLKYYLGIDGYFELFEKLRYDEEVRPNILNKMNRKRYRSLIGGDFEEKLIIPLKVYHYVTTMLVASNMNKVQ